MNDRELERGGPFEIDLLELFYRLLENGWRILAAALAGMLLAALYSCALATPVYEATSRIYVTNSSGDAAGQVAVSDFQIGNYLTSDYRQLFESWEIHDAVIRNLGLELDCDALKERLRIENPDDTRILNMTVAWDDPLQAARIANEYATVARAYISRTMDTGEPTLLSSARAPSEPVRPRKLLYTALGFLLGGLLAAGALTVRFLLDDRIKSAEDLRKYLEMPVLAVVPANGTMEGGRGEGGA